MFEIHYHRLVLAKDLKKMPKDVQARIMRAITKKLSTKPELFGKPLRNELKGYYRLRVGDYRVVYSVKQGIVTVFVLHIGMRKDFLAYIEAAKRLKLS